MQTIHAIFENGVFRPVVPVELPERAEFAFEPRWSPRQAVKMELRPRPLVFLRRGFARSMRSSASGTHRATPIQPLGITSISREWRIPRYGRTDRCLGYQRSMACCGGRCFTSITAGQRSASDYRLRSIGVRERGVEEAVSRPSACFACGTTGVRFGVRSDRRRTGRGVAGLQPW